MNTTTRWPAGRLQAWVTVVVVLSLAPVPLMAAQELTLELRTLELPMPALSGPLLEREARLHPGEHELAQRLRLLIGFERYEKGLEEMSGIDETIASPALLALRAQLYFKLKRYKEAEEDYQKALAAMPDFARVHADIARLYLVTEHFAEARSHIARAISLGLGDASTYSLLAYLNLKEHDGWSAVSAYQNALALDPDAESLRHGLLYALLDTDQYESASALLLSMLKREPDNQELWIRRANIGLQTGQHDMALASLEAAIRLGDVSAHNKNIAARLNLEQQNFSRSVSLFEEAIGDGSIDMALIDDAFAWLLREGSLEHARTFLDALGREQQTLSPTESARYLYFRGQLAFAADDWSDSTKWLRESLNLDPGNGEAMLLLAGIYEKRNNYTQAELLYERAGTIPDIRLQALLGKARVYLARDEHAAALAQLTTAYQEFPRHHEIRDNIEILENVIQANRQIGSL